MVSVVQPGALFFEGTVLLLGLACLVWLTFRPSGRAWLSRPAALPAWNIRLLDLLLLAGLVFVLGLAWQIALQVTVGGALRGLPDAEIVQYVLFGSIFHVGALFTWWLARAYKRRLQRVSHTATIATRVLDARAIRWAALTFLAAMPLLAAAALVWEPLLRIAGLPTARQEIVDLLIRARSPLALGLIVGMALVVGPMAEELVFRAGIFRYLRTRSPRWVAFAVSAGLFALLHANWASFLPLFILGLILAFAYERTGRLTVPILAHAFFNLNSLLLVLAGVGH